LRYLKIGDAVVIFGNDFGIVEGNDHPTSYAISIRSLQKIIENYPYNMILEDYIFCNGEIFLSFHNSSFALRYFLNVNVKAIV
jgi:hypothetical protein